MRRTQERYIFSWTELVEAISQGGCPICNTVEKKLEQTYRHLFREEIINPDCREQIRTGLGFCQLHAQRLLAIETNESHDHYLTALYYADLVSSLVSALKPSGLDPRALRKNVADLIGSRNGSARIECRLCQAKRTHEQFFIGELLGYLDLADFVEPFRRYAWFCLPHFHQVLKYPVPAKHESWIVTHQLSCLERLVDQLNSYQEQIFKASKTRIAEWIRSPELAVDTLRGKPI